MFRARYPASSRRTGTAPSPRRHRRAQAELPETPRVTAANSGGVKKGEYQKKRRLDRVGRSDDPGRRRKEHQGKKVKQRGGKYHIGMECGIIAQKKADNCAASAEAVSREMNGY